MSGSPKLKKYVVIIPDGAPDKARLDGLSPLEKAHIPNMDFVANKGITGLMQTLFPDLPKGSLVAQLGMLGWNPHKYYPHGRASAEALAVGLKMSEEDIAFRANFVLMERKTLKSYSANYIPGEKAVKLVRLVNSVLRREFPDFELSHAAEFRNVLIVRRAKVNPKDLLCPEPHEHQGDDFEIGGLVTAKSPNSEECVGQINRYLARAEVLLKGKEANALFLWSPSAPLILPNFNEINEIEGKCAIVGNMDFLKGIAVAGGLEFHLIGNGYINTDYQAKGEATIELLKSGCRFVYCHINAPDEAAHMGNIESKIDSLEKIDFHIVKRIVHHFQDNPGQLGGLIIAPDHYTNTGTFYPDQTSFRQEMHSAIPVPFALWNNDDSDAVNKFSENAAIKGKFGATPIGSERFLEILGIRPRQR